MVTYNSIEQIKRFEAFMSTCDKLKIGKRYLHLMHTTTDKYYYFSGYCYLMRVLSVVAKVDGSITHPNFDCTFCDLLHYEILTALSEEKKAARNTPEAAQTTHTILNVKYKS